MDSDARDSLLLIGKSIVFVVGGVMAIASLVDLRVTGLRVDGGWNVPALVFLLVGLALLVPPLAFAFRDALREARKGRL